MMQPMEHFQQLHVMVTHSKVGTLLQTEQVQQLQLIQKYQSLQLSRSMLSGLQTNIKLYLMATMELLQRQLPLTRTSALSQDMEQLIQSAHMLLVVQEQDTHLLASHIMEQPIQFQVHLKT